MAMYTPSETLLQKQLDEAMRKLANQHKTITAIRRELDGKRAQIAMLSAKLDDYRNPHKARRR